VANKRKLTGECYLKIINGVLAHFKRVLIVADALDESLEEAFAQAFADLLQTAANSGVVAQVILTSREDLKVKRSIEAMQPQGSHWPIKWKMIAGHTSLLKSKRA
jgi:hypothetical protein